MPKNAVQLQYEAYVNTPKLWWNNSVYGLEQFSFKTETSMPFSDPLPKGIRLGKRVEQFVFHELRQVPQLNLVAQNLQIQQEKHTLGEIDALLVKDGTTIHLEIIYKFYVYDASVGSSELEHWIGPNRKDSLVEKLNKLKHKQLPLLYHQETLRYLNTYQLDISNIKQQVLFKAQLFVPYKHTQAEWHEIHPACIMGYYLKQGDLIDFKDCKFYIPKKANWLLQPQIDVSWLSLDAFSDKMIGYFENQQSPMVWIKHPKGRMDKVFVVWW